MTGGAPTGSGCVFCLAGSSEDPALSLTLFVGEKNFVLMNRYPYTNGHLMVAPIEHAASPRMVSRECRAESMELVVLCQEVLESAYHPDGFNVGINIGRAAGAGIADHFHIHVVPRWSGDTNFMAPIAETRMIPESLDDSFKRLKECFDEKK